MGIDVSEVLEYEGLIVGIVLDGCFFGWLLLVDSVCVEVVEVLVDLCELGLGW